MVRGEIPRHGLIVSRMKHTPPSLKRTTSNHLQRKEGYEMTFKTIDQTRHYADDTYVTTSGPWGLYSLPGRALCSDGVCLAVTLRLVVSSD